MKIQGTLCAFFMAVTCNKPAEAVLGGNVGTVIRKMTRETTLDRNLGNRKIDKCMVK